MDVNLIDPPTAGDLRLIREGLGLSQTELAGALGFGPNGAQTVRAWEYGEKDGKPFWPTPLAWAALRYLVMVVEMYQRMDRESENSARIRRLLPECLR